MDHIEFKKYRSQQRIFLRISNLIFKVLRLRVSKNDKRKNDFVL